MPEGIPNHFDRSKPFYPLVMGYLVQLHGLKELLARGLPRMERVIQFTSTHATTEEAAEVSAQLQQLLGPLRL
jgi:hypothetical protein